MNSSTIPLLLMEIEGDGFHLMLFAIINGQVANLLLDTGASKSVLDFNRVERFANPLHFKDSEKLSTGLGTNSMQSQQTSIDSIRFIEVELFNYEMVLLDLNHVNESYAKLGIPAIDGVMGSDILHRYNAVIDYKNLSLTLSDSEPLGFDD